MGPSAFVQLGRIGLHPAPDAGGMNSDAAFSQKFGNAFEARGYRRYHRTARRITSPGKWRHLNALVGVIGMRLYLPDSFINFATEPLLETEPAMLWAPLRSPATSPTGQCAKRYVGTCRGQTHFSVAVSSRHSEAGAKPRGVEIKERRIRARAWVFHCRVFTVVQPSGVIVLIHTALFHLCMRY